MSSRASAAAYAAWVDAERRAASSARSAALSCDSESPAAASARAPASATSASAHAAAAAAAAVHTAPGPLRRGERRGFLVAGTAEREEEDAALEEEEPVCCRLSIRLSICLASTSLISSTSLSPT